MTDTVISTTTADEELIDVLTAISVVTQPEKPERRNPP